MSLLGHGASGSSSWQRTRDGSRPLKFKYISVFIIHIRLPSSCQACFHILSQPPLCPSDYTLHPLFLPHRRRRQRRPPNSCLRPPPTTRRPIDLQATTSPLTSRPRTTPLFLRASSPPTRLDRRWRHRRRPHSHQPLRPITPRTHCRSWAKRAAVSLLIPFMRFLIVVRSFWPNAIALMLSKLNIDLAFFRLVPALVRLAVYLSRPDSYLSPRRAGRGSRGTVALCIRAPRRTRNRQARFGQCARKQDPARLGHSVRAHFAMSHFFGLTQRL